MLTGIARLAEQAPLLEAKRRVQYFELASRSLVNRASGSRVPFDWTINPYRGCEYGCQYCYARYTHEFMELREPGQFEQMIYAKQFDSGEFRRSLSRIPREDRICIGTATDPYQPAERRYEVTRRILEVFAEESGRHLSLTTKSDLVVRDAELLRDLGRSNVLHVFATIGTLDEELARKLEPYAPRPMLRMRAVERLAADGVRMVVMASPVIPLINDRPGQLEAVAAAAARSGAQYMVGGVLFLKPCAQKVFLPFLEQQFPHLVRRYRERYDGSGFLRGEYPRLIGDRIRGIREKYGLTRKPDAYLPELWHGEAQLRLFD